MQLIPYVRSLLWIITNQTLYFFVLLKLLVSFIVLLCIDDVISAGNFKDTCNTSVGGRNMCWRKGETVSSVDVIQRRIVLNHAECVRSGDGNGESKERNNG